MIQKASLKYPLTSLALCLASLTLMPSCQNKNQTKTDQNTSSETKSVKSNTGVTIAYVNIDTLEAKYIYFKQAKEDFEKRQAVAEAQIKASATQFQNEYISFQKKVQAGTMSQTEGEAIQKKLASMQQGLETKRQNLSNQLMEEQDQFTQKLQNQLDSFLTIYNKDKHYDYIFSHVKGGGILLANPAYDITNDVVNEMNKAYQSKNSSVK